MSCTIFKYCDLASHKDSFACRMARDLYYGQHTGREIVLVCPTCLVLCHPENDSIRFYQVHHWHLGEINVADKSLAIFKSQAKELKAALVNFVSPGLPAIPRPTKFLDNADLTYGPIIRSLDGPCDFKIPPIVDVFLKSQRGRGQKHKHHHHQHHHQEVPSTSVGPLEAAMPSTSTFKQPSVDDATANLSSKRRRRREPEQSTSVGPLKAH